MSWDYGMSTADPLSLMVKQHKRYVQQNLCPLPSSLYHNNTHFISIRSETFSFLFCSSVALS